MHQATLRRERVPLLAARRSGVRRRAEPGQGLPAVQEPARLRPAAHRRLATQALRAASL